MGRWSVRPATGLWIGPIWTLVVFAIGFMAGIGPPVARVFLAVSSAIAMACFWGRPEWTSSLMFELTVFCEEPFFRGIASSWVRGITNAEVYSSVSFKDKAIRVWEPNILIGREGG